MTVGEHLKQALWEKHMTQKQLAEKLHVSESTVQKWCTDRNAIPADKLVDVACALKLNVLVLLGMRVNDTDYELVTVEQLVPGPFVFQECPVCQEYQLDLAFRYMVLEHYKLEEGLTAEEMDAIKNEQMEILTSEIGTNTDEVIQAMWELDQQGRLFERVVIKVNKYEQALHYAFLDLRKYLSSVSEEELIKTRLASVPVNQPFCTEEDGEQNE